MHPGPAGTGLPGKPVTRALDGLRGLAILQPMRLLLTPALPRAAPEFPP